MIPAKRKAVPVNFQADKENIEDSKRGGRGSGTASKKAKMLIEVCQGCIQSGAHWDPPSSPQNE